MEKDVLEKLAAGFNCVYHFAILYVFDLSSLLGFSQETGASQKILAALCGLLIDPRAHRCM